MLDIPVLKTLPEAARPDDPLAEKTLSEEEAWRGGFLRVIRNEVALPDGARRSREFLRHPGAAGIVLLFEDDTVLLERQWRHPMGRSFWELPAGKLDPKEAPLVCAKRELHEETGFSARRWTELGTLHNAIGYSNEGIVMFLAVGPAAGEQALDDGEFLELVRVPRREATAMALDGRITDVKTIIGLVWADRVLSTRA